MLRKYDYSESSQILRLFTREQGILSVLAKGTKKAKSSFGGALDLFYRGRATVIRRPRSGLHLLTAFAVENAHAGLRRGLHRLYGACHLAELLIGLMREEEPHPELYDALVEGLLILSGAAEEPAASLLASLELSILAVLGFAPSIDGCASCGSDPGAGPADLSVRLGGVLCADCRGEDPRRTRIGPGTLRALRHLATAPPRRAMRLRLARGDAAAIRSFLTAFEEWRLERGLRSARFL